MLKVSIIMSVYKGERYLAAAIDSILSQTFSDFEFIIIDDGSTDTTAKILQNYSDSRLIVITQKNQGLTVSLNKAAKLAKGLFIARMDADDISEPTRLEKQYKFLRDNTEVGMVGTWYIEIDDSGKEFGEKKFPTTDIELRQALIRYNPFCHGSVMFRKELFDKVGGYDETFEKAQDYDLWFKLAEHTKFANIPEYLLKRRYTDDNISVAAETEQIRFAVLARKKAIKKGLYPYSSYIYLIRPIVISRLPVFLRRIVRKVYKGSNIHS